MVARATWITVKCTLKLSNNPVAFTVTGVHICVIANEVLIVISSRVVWTIALINC